MQKALLSDTPLYQFDIFKDFSDRLFHGVYTRHTTPDDMHAHIEKNTGSKPIFFKKQLHGDSVQLVLGPSDSEKGGDAFITKQANIPLAIRVADCASILIYDPCTHAIATIHAGWRGLAKRIIRNAVGEMAGRFGSDPSNMHVGISPMLGPCCSVFSDPLNELPRFLHLYITEENTVNLWAITENQLRECGIPKNHIENPRLCTACNPEEFFSYRRDRDTNRFFTTIMLK